jgi:hypothetical protein
VLLCHIDTGVCVTPFCVCRVFRMVPRQSFCFRMTPVMDRLRWWCQNICSDNENCYLTTIDKITNLLKKTMVSKVVRGADEKEGKKTLIEASVFRSLLVTQDPVWRPVRRYVRSQGCREAHLEVFFTISRSMIISISFFRQA